MLPSEQPLAVVLAGEQCQGYDGAKRKRGSKLHSVADTPGQPLALCVTPASTDDCAKVGRLA